MNPRPALLVLLMALALPAGAGHTADSPPTEDVADTFDDLVASRTYWLRKREGWFWYRDPRQSQRQSKTAPPREDRPKELIEFEAMQKRLEELKRIAVMNPTDGHLLAYMRYQQHVMGMSETFAQRWQRLVWSTPTLDHALAARPTNTVAIAAFDEQQRERQAEIIRRLAATHGLVFIFRGDCPYCHRFAPILKRFEQTYGMTVFAVSLDGQGLPEYPSPQADNGIATRLNATVVPALYLSAPARREIRPVGFGVMAMSDLIERIAALAQAPNDAPL